MFIVFLPMILHIFKFSSEGSKHNEIILKETHIFFSIVLMGSIPLSRKHNETPLLLLLLGWVI
jgi:hypothetical protein